MTVLDEVKRLSASGGVGVDVITYALRARGISDSDIRSAYTELFHSTDYVFNVEKGMGYFAPKGS